MVGFVQPTPTGRYSAASALRTLLCNVAAYSLTSGKGIGPTTRGWVLAAQAFRTQTNPHKAAALLKPKLIPPVNNALTLCAPPHNIVVADTPTRLLLHSTHSRFFFPDKSRSIDLIDKPNG